MLDKSQVYEIARAHIDDPVSVEVEPSPDGRIFIRAQHEGQYASTWIHADRSEDEAEAIAAKMNDAFKSGDVAARLVFPG